ncbi:PREDICTED: protein RER1B-like [Ipomoea nil]|uniref:protein RER1B-like n=1 Tax=Ipomoea nil TaxID=35883 RepID=UPI000901949E|nr:PREDICTED: protein RER1B-like [Ipomoea nil]
MEGVGSAGAAPTQPRRDIPKPFQHYLDKTRPHPLYRWIGTFIFAILFALRVYSIQGFYVVTFFFGIFILCALVDFLTPLVNPSLQTSDGPSDEFKPFIRLLPEFVFWFDFTLAFCVAFVLTFFSVFDSHYFHWQELLIFWILYFIYIMTCQIGHMLKYKYIPFNIGKQKYGGKETVAGGGLVEMRL